MHVRRLLRHPLFLILCAIPVLASLAGKARAAEADVRAALDEAAGVHAIATAARLCNLIGEGELRLSAARMDRVHASQLDANDQETYLILRASDSFRNAVFAAALRRAQSGCAGELGAAWRDVESSLVAADLQSGVMAQVGGPTTR